MPESHQRHNGLAAEELRRFVERVEVIRTDKKDLSEDEKLVMAEAQAAGFNPAMIRHVIKVRSKKPSEVEEARALEGLYLSALGMQKELPLFRSIDLISVDVSAKEQVIEALKKFVPSNGSIVIETGGKPLRLCRDQNGDVSVSDVEKPKRSEPPESASSAARKTSTPVPECSADEAEEMGREAAQKDIPIIKNPFPFGDSRRARWDLGWRKEAGNDGMGPDD